MKGNAILVSAADGCTEPAWMAKTEPFLQKVLAERRIENWELSVMYCNDPCIAQLNKQYRGIDAPTDVLSFEQGDEYVDDDGDIRFSAGDIVISLDMLKKNASDFSVSADEELKRLLIHGVLHLSGMDHISTLDEAAEDWRNNPDGIPEQEMLVIQERLLPLFLDEKIIDTDII